MVGLGIGRPDNLSVEIIENEQEENYRLIPPDNIDVIYWGPENIPENKWVWTDENRYWSRENITIHFKNSGEENLMQGGGPDWYIERYEDGVWEKVNIFPPDAAWLMILRPPLKPGEVESFVWDQTKALSGTRSRKLCLGPDHTRCKREDWKTFTAKAS
ncbi:hypothetical protein AKJ64_05190 [candidate division MSBL1 archaeon SCGC-AAA259E17]|uniref:Uncharacterized protein n=1 Tax=candidate division MSBL1 archaeon SCGC-AAA259E17 TaxID=1698263 RepID=A0A133U9H3_9EURY|nr:hypothetical protein AKJ64_05190 [candidate division MSBL1 archaeon SCGC-AAA259E17]